MRACFTLTLADDNGPCTTLSSTCNMHWGHTERAVIRTGAGVLECRLDPAPQSNGAGVLHDDDVEDTEEQFHDAQEGLSNEEEGEEEEAEAAGAGEGAAKKKKKKKVMQLLQLTRWSYTSLCCVPHTTQPGPINSEVAGPVLCSSHAVQMLSLGSCCPCVDF